MQQALLSSKLTSAAVLPVISAERGRALRSRMIGTIGERNGEKEHL
ncbi:MAG: hypothetical protein HYR60_09840 [Acidobacteria bacterium]|nr:hypothetical protein [Acidobacteriota bacterium]